MRGDFEIVNVTIPVVPDIVDGSGRQRGHTPNIG
jgi:hypothetical protein